MELIPQGTIVICSRKHHHIGAMTEPLKSGDPLKLSALNFNVGQDRIQGDRPNCAICGSPYWIDGKVHTLQGWLPSEPVMEPVKPHKVFVKGQVKARARQDTEEKKQEKRLKKVRDKKKKDKKDREDKKDKKDKP
jgi:hypothetical protein